MWANLAVVVILLGCASYQYLKGTFVKAFAMIIAALCASVVAFGYFELLASFFVTRSADSRFQSVVPWAQPLSFVLLFVLAFAVLQTVLEQLLRKPVDLGELPERVGRVVCGIFLGLILAGLLLTTLAMAPLPNEYPYRRFDLERPDPAGPGKALLNPDGFAAGWFAMLSGGSFSGQRNFSSLHPDFLNEAFLNRLQATEDISVITPAQVIEVPSRKEKAVWPAPEDIKDTLGNLVPQKPRHILTFVRTGIRKPDDAGGVGFTLSQLRLICKERTTAQNLSVGKAESVYPIGYMKTPERLQMTELSDTMRLASSDFDDAVRRIDFAFYVPVDLQPALVAFKQNNIAVLPPPAATDEAPPPVPFVQMSQCPTDSAELKPVSSARLYGVELAADVKFLSDLAVRIDSPEQWQAAQTQRSLKPARFDDGRISHVRAELRIEAPADREPEKPRPTKSPKRKRRPRRPKKYVEETAGIRKMLKPLSGYKLLSLKCNTPSTGSAIKGEELPILIELSGSLHYPVGVITSGRVDGQNICEVDYCALTAEQVPGGLVIGKDGAVAQPFPDSIWLTERAERITEFYVLYLVESGRNAIITAVQPAGAKIPAQFEKAEGLLVK